MEVERKFSISALCSDGGPYRKDRKGYSEILCQLLMSI